MAAPIMEFSPNNEFFAFCGPDGTLKVWDTATNVLKQEFASATHLSASCTCLKWRPERNFGQSKGTSKRKRLKTGASTSAKDFQTFSKSSIDLIALGTSSGSILLYSVLRGDLQAQWGNGHALQVNDIAWCESTNVLYSCASDSHILEWNVENGCKKPKLKTDGPVYSICLCNGDTMMLSASRSIKLWDLAEMIVLQTFTGHATEVFRLVDIPVKRHKDQNFYFLSAARDDRYVQIWQFKSSLRKKSQQNALATMLLPDDAKSLNVAGPLQEDGSYLFSVTTVAGFTLLFQQVLNGESSKPLQPKVKLQFASANLDVPKQMPVLSAAVVENEKLLVSYGNPMKPTFERISYGFLKPDNCLLREEDLSLVDKVGGVSKTKTPVTSDDAKILTAGHLVPSKPAQTVSTSGKRKRKRHTSEDMTVAERLDVMGLTETTDKPSLQTTSSAVLLTQGLQSRDSQILNHVLQNSNPVFIRNSIRKLPFSSVIPLVDELVERLQGHAQAVESIIHWTKALLTIYSSYILTVPDLVQPLSRLYQMMDSRVSAFGRMNKLQGSLDFMLFHVSDQSAADSSEPIDALVTFQDESSDEDMLITENEEENWKDEDDESEIEDDVEKIEEEVDEEEEELEDEEDPKDLEDEEDDDVDDNSTKWLNDCNGEELMEEDG